jgi:amino acid transporter
MNLHRIKCWLFGAPLDPLKDETRKHLALVTFFAWIGIGADGLSSANYGPEEAFLALAGHTHMAIFLAIATAITVFLIATAYLQVIELFPNGGGGYRVASNLLGPKAGLVAGGALLIDYVLSIAIATAAGVDALFSLLPLSYHPYKVSVIIGIITLLIYLNLRGVKESIKILLPLFLGFVITHTFLVGYAIIAHADALGTLMPNAVEDSVNMADSLGWVAVLALFFKAFSLGGGTYTGLETVSNSAQNLAEPRVKTGKATMMAVAASLALMASGIILMYLLWDVEHIPGKTLNAAAFSTVTANWELFGENISSQVVGVTMIFAMGLLFVAGNTGFIAGPAVLASMAVDRWMPHMFSALSSRLVTKNGIILMGLLAIGAILVTGGAVHVLVILYSINVFLTFTLSLAGVTRYQWQRRKNPRNWGKLIIAFLAFVVCGLILVMTLTEKFTSGGWKTVFVTGLVIALGLLIKRHYDNVKKRLAVIEEDLAAAMFTPSTTPQNQDNTEDRAKPELDHSAPTAVFFVGNSAASGMHTFLWVKRLFPGVFKNFVFASVGEIDIEEFSDKSMWHKLRRDTKQTLKHYVDFCSARNKPATYYHAYGTDVIDSLSDLADKIVGDFPRAVFFATKLSFSNENYFSQLLHNQTAYLLQKKLHNKGLNLIIMPMKV